MNRLETIHLRLAGATPLKLVADIGRAISVAGEATAVRVYRHSTVVGDLSIHLHLGPGDGAERSTLGAHLARSLREFGLVEHTVWLEVDNTETD